MDYQGNQGRPFTFRKSGSDNEGGAEKSVGTGDGGKDAPTGFIDPQIARTTAGQDGPASASAQQGDATDTASPAEPARRRGRPKGSTNKSKDESGQASSLNINGVEKILFSIHAVAAATFKIPELEITEDEAKRVSKAVAGVSDHYKVMLDPKTAAWIDLGREICVVYGTRAVSIYVRVKAEKHMPAKVARPQPAAQTRDPNPINDPMKMNGSGVKHETGEAKLPPGFDPTNIKLAN